VNWESPESSTYRGVKIQVFGQSVEPSADSKAADVQRFPVNGMVRCRSVEEVVECGDKEASHETTRGGHPFG